MAFIIPKIIQTTPAKKIPNINNGVNFFIASPRKLFTILTKKIFYQVNILNQLLFK